MSLELGELPHVKRATAQDEEDEPVTKELGNSFVTGFPFTYVGFAGDSQLAMSK